MAVLLRLFPYLQKKISQFSSLNNHVSRFDSLIIELNDIGSELVSYTNNINANENDLLEITKRLDLINNLLKKNIIKIQLTNY